MNQHAPISNTKIGHSACPHDCPSTCALDVEILDERTIGRVRGAKDNSYTAGVICAKVARYAERVHHPDRLKHPLVRLGLMQERELESATVLDVTPLGAATYGRAISDGHVREIKF